MKNAVYDRYRAAFVDALAKALSLPEQALVLFDLAKTRGRPRPRFLLSA